MDRLLTITILFSLLFVSCDKYVAVYDYNSAETLNNLHNPLGMLALDKDNILIYGDNQTSRCFTLFENTGLVLLKNDGATKVLLDSFVNVYSVLKYNSKQFLVYYRHTYERKPKIALLDKDGNCKEIKIDFHKIIPLTNYDSIQVNPQAMAIDSCKNIYFSYYAYGYLDKKWRYEFYKIDSLGNLDLNFKKNLSLFDDRIYSIAIDKRSNIYLGGRFRKYNNQLGHSSLLALDSTGKILEKFPLNSSNWDSNTVILTIKLYDSTIYIGGWFSDYKNHPTIKSFLRLDYCGNIHNKFNYNQIGFDCYDSDPWIKNGFVYSIDELNDSTLIISGFFDRFNNIKGYNSLALLSKNARWSKNISFGQKTFLAHEACNINQNTLIFIGDLYTDNINFKFIKLIKFDNISQFFQEFNGSYKVILWLVAFILLLINLKYHILKNRLSRKIHAIIFVGKKTQTQTTLIRTMSFHKIS